jgi:hypothetical protein
MVRFFQRFFSIPTAIVASMVAIGLLAWVITHEESIQLSKSHLWAEQFVSEPLLETVTFTQDLDVPDNLSQESFLIGLFFGCSGTPCAGGVQVSLTQRDHSQSHSVTEISPAPTLRRRFKFDGFSEGAATLTVSGLPGNTEMAPGILYIKEGKGALLKGPELEGPAYASIDWFKVVPGERKLPSVFPNLVISILWFASFAGLFSLAWRGMRPEKVDPPAESGNSGTQS